MPLTKKSERQSWRFCKGKILGRILVKVKFHAYFLSRESSENLTQLLGHAFRHWIMLRMFLTSNCTHVSGLEKHANASRNTLILPSLFAKCYSHIFHYASPIEKLLHKNKISSSVPCSPMTCTSSRWFSSSSSAFQLVDWSKYNLTDTHIVPRMSTIMLSRTVR